MTAGKRFLFPRQGVSSPLSLVPLCVAPFVSDLLHRECFPAESTVELHVKQIEKKTEKLSRSQSPVEIRVTSLSLSPSLSLTDFRFHLIAHRS